MTDEKNYDNNNYWDFINGLFFSYNTDKLYFEVKKIIDRTPIEEITIDKNDSEFYGLLRLMFSIDDSFDLEETLKVLLKQIGHPMPITKISLIQL